MFLFIVFFFKERKWPNGEDGIHWYDPANEVKDYVHIREVLMIIHHWR